MLLSSFGGGGYRSGFVIGLWALTLAGISIALGVLIIIISMIFNYRNGERAGLYLFVGGIVSLLISFAFCSFAGTENSFT
jgi:hypothetical protein